MGAILGRLADPNLALLIIALGLLAVMAVLGNIGLIDLLAGAAGLLLLASGAVMLGALPVRPAGAVLLTLAAALLVAELHVQVTAGLLAAAGTILWLVAWPVIFAQGATVHPAVLVTSALLTGGTSMLAGRVSRRVRQSRRSAPVVGREALIGRRAVVRSARGRLGRVRLDGALWTARSADGPLHGGQVVEVVDVNGLRLVVVDATRGGQPESFSRR